MAVVQPTKNALFLGLNVLVRPKNLELGISAKSHVVILSVARDLVFSCSYEILRSLCSLRMTGEGTFAEVSPLNIQMREEVLI
jgi:hypothetical protein